MTKDLEVVKKELEQYAPKVVGMAYSLVIKSESDRKNAMDIVKSVKLFIRDANDYWADTVDKAYDAWKSLKQKQNDMVKPAEKAEKEIKAKIADWDLKQEQTRKALQDALEAEQKEKSDKLLEKAQKAEEKGNTAKADMFREQAANLASTAVIIPEAEKREGENTRYKYSGVVEKAELVPEPFWCPDQKEIDAYLQRTEGARPIPGVKIIKTPIISVRI